MIYRSSWSSILTFDRGEYLQFKEFPHLCRCDLAFVAPKNLFPGRGLTEILLALGKKKKGVFEKNIIVATPFPSITRYFLWKHGGFSEIESKGREPIAKKWFVWEKDPFLYNGFPLIKRVEGAEELQVLLGLADLALTRVETGETLRNHDLVVVERLMTSNLVLVGKKAPEVAEFIARFA